VRFPLNHAYVYACVSSSHSHVCAHIDSTSGLVWRTVLGPHTRLHRPCSRPPSPHACPCTTSHPHIPHIPSLLLDVQRLSSVLSRASGMGHQAGLVCSLPVPHTECVSLSPADAIMQTQAAGQRKMALSVIDMSHYGPQCAHTDDTAAPSSSGHSISTRH
jgi:hypothetical protein